LENYLENSIAFSPDQNYIFLKIGKKYIEQHFFLGKEYLTSYIDSLNDLQNRSKEEVILELSNERSKQVESLAQQMGNTNSFDLVIYGNSISESVKDTLKNGLSLSVEYATIGSYPEKDGYKFIEAWGSIL
jgi:DNA gyrase/topoisomerase IV subunit B